MTPEQFEKAYKIMDEIDSIEKTIQYLRPEPKVNIVSTVFEIDVNGGNGTSIQAFRRPSRAQEPEWLSEAIDDGFEFIKSRIVSRGEKRIKQLRKELESI